MIQARFVLSDCKRVLVKDGRGSYQATLTDTTTGKSKRNAVGVLDDAGSPEQIKLAAVQLKIWAEEEALAWLHGTDSCEHEHAGGVLGCAICDDFFKDQTVDADTGEYQLHGMETSALREQGAFS